jgi:hypothetical protein
VKNILFIITIINIIFFVLHEIDAIFRGEWKMFSFLRKYDEKTQKLIFITAHLPLPSILISYLYVVFSLSYWEVFIIINLLAVLHFVIHSIAKRWESNVFRSSVSDFLIYGFACTGIINLIIYHISY